MIALGYPGDQRCQRLIGAGNVIGRCVIDGTHEASRLPGIWDVRRPYGADIGRYTGFVPLIMDVIGGIHRVAIAK
ncbi:hypothetical protein GCM10009611_17160 [Arthrobacter roseus]